MNIIIPKTLKADDIIFNNLAGDTTTVYDPLTDYVLDLANPTIVRIDKESDGITDAFPQKLYELVADSPAGNYPPDSTLWYNNGAISKDRMFDTYMNTQSGADGLTELPDYGTSTMGKIIFEIDSSLMTSIALFGLQGTSITFELLDSAGLAIEPPVSYGLLDYDSISDYYGYWFTEFLYKENLAHTFYISHVSKMRVTIVDDEVGRYPKCGYVVLGQRFDIGKSQFGASSSIVDFSTQEENKFGYLYLNQGNYADTLDVDVRVLRGQFDAVKRALTGIRSTPTVFNCNNDTTDATSLLLLAKYDSFDLIMTGPTYVDLNLNLRGLI